jgi:hypothetical protein
MAIPPKKYSEKSLFHHLIQDLTHWCAQLINQTFATVYRSFRLILKINSRWRGKTAIEKKRTSKEVECLYGASIWSGMLYRHL